MKGLMKNLKRKLAMILAVLMTVTSVPMTAFAAAEPVLIPEQKIDDSCITDGMFYFGSAGAEIGEADPGIYRLFVRRSGTDLPEASVRVTMLDMTASYGKDYTVSAEGVNILTGGVRNSHSAASIKEYMQENEDTVTEYNYSDAIIDGSITSENQMSEEEINELELSDEQMEEMKRSMEDAAEFMLYGTVFEEAVPAIASPSVAEMQPEDTAAEAANAVEAAEATEGEAAAEAAETGTLGTAAEKADVSSFASLAEAKEYATGLKDDRQEMSLAGGSSPISIVDDLSSQSAGYMSNSLTAVTDTLSSAYVILAFREGETEKYIDIQTIDDHLGEGDVQSGFNLSAENDEQISGMYGNFTLKIIDDEEYEPAMVEFSEGSYFPEDGFITVTVKRSANLNSLASVMLDTEDYTALNTRDYSKVHAQVIFGFGITERTVKIPVITDHLTEDQVFFRMKLQEPTDCVVGERDTAEGIIRRTDTSFRTETAETADAELLSAAEETDTSLLSAGQIGLRDIIVADNSEDLPNRAYSSSVQSSDSYSHADGSKWVLYAKDSWHDVSSSVAFSFSEMHYDYSGLQVVWDRQSGKPNYGWTKFKYVDRDHGKSSTWENLYYKSTERWGKDTDTYFFRNGVKASYEYAFELRRENGWLGTSPKLTIHEIRPVYRPFMIGLQGSEPVDFIAPDGTTKSNKDIPGLESANTVCLLNSNDNTLITNTKGANQGNSITVYLADPKTTYISALELVSWDGQRAVTVMSGLDESTKSVSLTINNDLIASNKDLIDFVQIDGKDRGDYGRFRVRAVLKPKTAKLTIKEDDRATVTVEDGNGGFKSGTTGGGVTKYDFHVGDTAIYHVKMKDQYSAAYTWNEIKVSDDVPKGDTVGRYREHGRDAQGKDITLDTTRAMLTATETSAVTQYSQKSNRLTVRVKKNVVDMFEKTGIFVVEPETEGEYYDYVIDKDAVDPVTHSEISHVAGTRYTLVAEPKDKNSTAVWCEMFSPDVKFMQNEFCFEGTGDIDTNTLLLTAEKSDGLYALTGQAFYSDASLDGSVSADKWHKAPGIYVMVGKAQYGITDNEGRFETLTFPGKKGYNVKYRTYADGDELWKTFTLSGRGEAATGTDPATGKTVTYRREALGTFLVNPFSGDRVHFNTVTSTTRTGVVSRNISINSDITTLEADLQLIDPLTGENYRYTYADKNGKKQIAEEKVTDVVFVVVDPITKKQKTTYAARKSDTDPAKWSYAASFETGYYAQYKSGDLLYVKMITDRIVGEDTGKKVCEYAMVNTGIVFTEPNPKVPNIVDVNFPVGEFYKLPIIGDLTCFVNAVGMSFGTTPTEEGGVRIFFGKQISPKNNHFDGNGKITSDTGFEYGISDILEVKKTFSDMSDLISIFGSKNKLGAMSLGIPAWSIEPMAGIYFEFAMYHDPKGPVQTKYLFTGGGGYIGIMGSFRYTYYMLIAGIPVYIGGDVSLTLIGEFGVAVDAGKQIAYNDPDQTFIDGLLDNSHFEFVFQSVLSANAYAGVGICGTLGIRGGFNLTILFIYNPTIRRSYPDMREVGFAVTGSIKFWADVILLSVPIPVYTWDDWFKQGYFKDLDEKKKKKDESGANLLSAASDAVIVKKPRNEDASVFTGNETAEGSDAELLGGSGISMQEMLNFEEKTILKDGFDDPSQKLLNFTSGGREKILMVYLDDDKTRPEDERTRLMTTVYDVLDKTWSEPVAAGSDTTADFAPSICDAGNRIIITWLSRAKALGEKPQYADYLKSLDVFTAVFDKETLTIGKTEQLTDDACYDTTPNVIYDKDTDQAIVTYFKAEVPKIQTADELMKAAAPELNNSELMYMLYESGRWVRDKYYPGELAEGVDPKPLLEQFKGQRFVSSPLPGINNPVIGSSSAATAKIITYSNEQLEEERKKAAQNVVENSPETRHAALEKPRAELERTILATEKNMGVLAFSVDMDRNLSTDKDREVFVQTYNFKDHVSGKPIRITNDAVNDSQPQIAGFGGKSYLFWLSDGKVLKYIDLSTLLLMSGDGEYHGEITTAGVNMTSGAVEGVSVNNFRIFSQTSDSGRTEGESDVRCNLFVAWQEHPEQSETNEDADEEFCQDIFVSGLILEGGTDSGKEIGSGFWSEGVRMTHNGKVNEIPEFASLGGEKVMMVGNRFRMTGGEPGEAYQATGVELVSMTYEPQAQLRLDSVQVEDYPEKIGNSFHMTIGIRNVGLKAAESFSYGGYMTDEDGGFPASGWITGQYEEPVPAGGVAFIPVDAVMEDAKGTLVMLTQSKGGDVLSADTYYVFEDSNILLSDVQTMQEGSEFVITGTITNNSFGAIGSSDKALIYDTLGGKRLNCSFALPDLAVGKSGRFEVRVPAVAELCKYGYQDMTAVLVDENGHRISDYENLRAYLDQAFDLRVNGLANGEELTVTEGGELPLQASYTPDSYYRNGDAGYFVEDPKIAIVENGVLRGVSAGMTKIRMTIDPYGGESEFTVRVKKSASEESDDGETDMSEGPGNAGRMTGRWQQQADGSWKFLTSVGSAFTGWGYISTANGWDYYHMKADGTMDYGWFYDEAAKKWYYLNENHDGRFGAMTRGWHLDARDGKWYYLDPRDGHMAVGWILDKGKWYYLSGGSGTPVWTRNEKGEWVYSGAGRAAGSMYANEKTPDGYTVDATGAWTGK